MDADVDILLGPYGSNLVRAVIPVVTGSGKLMWNHGGSADDLAHPMVVSSPLRLPQRALLAGETVTSPEDGHYAFNQARLRPVAVQERLPIMIGGGGEKKTLRTVARYADMWNWARIADIDKVRHKDEVLQRHCEQVGRDHAEIDAPSTSPQ